MIVDMISSKNLNPIVAELIIRGRLLNISIALNFSSLVLFQSMR